jgi:primosomal protein N' (replication factor Y)
VHLVLPPDTDRKIERRLQLSEKGERARVFSAALGLTAADTLVLERFGAGERKDESRIAKSASARARVQKLVDAGFLEVVESLSPKGVLHVEERIVPLVPGDHAQVAEQGAGQGAVARAVVQPIPARKTALAAFDAWLRATVAATRAPFVSMESARAAHTGALGKVRELATLGRVRVDRVARAQEHDVELPVSAVRTLTEAQSSAVAAIEAAIHDARADAFLLDGVTGSGKTEVYLRALAACLRAGKSAIFLVPEIGLTPQLVARVRNALGDARDRVVLLHSGVPPAQRATALERMRTGAASVVIGARSALFAPAPALGLIVVDEEHDPSPKQDETPRYHARDVALWRAKEEGAVCVLGSATPSLESVHNADTGKLVRLELPARVGGGGVLPEVELLDLRTRAQHKTTRVRDRANVDEGPGVVLSAPLVEAIAHTLADGEQVLLFLNKRGYASALFCEACGHIEKCPDCSVSLTFHKKRGSLQCHQCDHEALMPATCPDCGTAGLLLLGTGTERLESELSARFPSARVARLDRDSTQKRGTLERTLRAIHDREVDVVIGTQMVAKGHDFPGVRLVGIVLADVALTLPDFRASERAFALLTQVAGRAGRGEKRGRVLVQTLDPTHEALRYMKQHDAAGFARVELGHRAKLAYPPYTRALLVRAEAPNPGDAQRLAERVAKVARAAATGDGAIRVTGPAPCPLERLHGRTRIHVLVRAPDHASRARVLNAIRADEQVKKSAERKDTRLILDLDPIHML